MGIQIRRVPSTIFFGALFIPTFVMVALAASSMAAGLAVYLCSMLTWLVVVSLTYNRTIPIWLVRRIVLFVGVGVLVVSVHALVAVVNNEQFNLARLAGSVALLGLMLLGATAFAIQIAGLHEATMARWVVIGLCFLALNALFGLAGISFFPPTTSKPVGIFSEPSLFGLVVCPLLTYACAARMRHARLALLFFVIWALAIQNLTTLMAALLAASVLAQFRFIDAIAVVAMILAITLYVDVQYFMDRLVISGESDNLSVLVLLQGWEHALIMLGESGGWGGGFQQFGFQGVSGDANDKLAKLGYEHLNVLDGGSVAAKMVGEFGYVGVAALVTYLYLFFRALRRARSASLYGSGGELFLAACIISFSIELFVRGVGYFTPTCFLALSGVFWTTCLRRESKMPGTISRCESPRTRGV